MPAYIYIYICKNTLATYVSIWISNTHTGTTVTIMHHLGLGDSIIESPIYIYLYL